MIVSSWDCKGSVKFRGIENVRTHYPDSSVESPLMVMRTPGSPPMAGAVGGLLGDLLLVRPVVGRWAILMRHLC